MRISSDDDTNDGSCAAFELSYQEGITLSPMPSGGSRERLLDAVWGYDNVPFTRTVDMHIAKLRKKIEDNPADPHLIVTVHRLGYKFVG